MCGLRFRFRLGAGSGECAPQVRWARASINQVVAGAAAVADAVAFGRRSNWTRRLDILFCLLRLGPTIAQLVASRDFDDAGAARSFQKSQEWNPFLRNEMDARNDEPATYILIMSGRLIGSFTSSAARSSAMNELLRWLAHQLRQQRRQSIDQFNSIQLCLCWPNGRTSASDGDDRV